MTVSQQRVVNQTLSNQSNTSDVASTLKKVQQQVQWQDLRVLSKLQIAYNLILPYPFLLLSWWFASQSWYLPACLATYFFFAAAFRQAHDGYHHSLNISKRATTAILLLLSTLLLTSLHSIRATHMEHHRNLLGDSDVEGSLAKLPWYQAMLGGVKYRFDIYRQGLTLSNRGNRRLAWLEFMLIFLVVAMIVISLLSAATPNVWSQVAAYHLITMVLANASVGVIAVWGVHHDCGDEVMARTERNNLVNALTFNLLYHAEHHLFPAVPSNHLPELARRLDEAFPSATQLRVIPTNRAANANDDLEPKHCPLRNRFA